jgi:hypothetical protein
MPDDTSRLHSFDDLTTRIWRDRRCTPGTRELLLAIAWVMARDPDYAGVPNAERGPYLWRQLAVMLGRDGRLRREPRYKQLVADDAPRYAPPNTWHDRFCEAPRIRPYKPRTTGSGILSPACLIGRHPHSGECRRTVVHSAASAAAVPKSAPDPSATCDAPAKLDFHLIERDPLTGWHIDHHFCARHRDHFERVKAQLANAPEAPEPVPNTGGMLPCYFKADWARVYSWARPGWTAPECGIAADDWAGVNGGGVAPRRPGLRLIVGELADV